MGLPEKLICPVFLNQDDFQLQEFGTEIQRMSSVYDGLCQGNWVPISELSCVHVEMWTQKERLRVGERGESEHKGLEMKNRKPGPVEEEGFLSVIRYSGSSDLSNVIYHHFTKINYRQFCESRAVSEEGHVWVHHTQSFKDLGHACKFSPGLLGSEAVFHLLIPGHAWNGCNCHSIIGSKDF